MSLDGTVEHILQEGAEREQSTVATAVADTHVPRTSPARELTAEDLLRQVVQQGASDLHLNVGVPPHLRVDGRLVALEAPKATPIAIEEIALSLLSQSEVAQFRATGDVETSHGFPGVGRFRISVSRQRGSVSLVARCIPYEHVPFEGLGLPESVREAIEKPAGLVLVTGATGSGKSTTLASIIEYINRTRACNIVTLEDPIEFLFPQQKAIIRQREVGQDTESFASGLKYVLRQDPDVVMVGEMRDLETMEGALFAAETGQLVFATLHTTDAPQAINRIVDSFPSRQQEQIRLVLSLVLQAVITQQLLPKASGRGRVLAAEVLVATTSVRNLIREGKVHQIGAAMETGAKDGMRTMSQSLLELVNKGLLPPEQAVAKGIDLDMLRAVEAAKANAPPPRPRLPGMPGVPTKNKVIVGVGGPSKEQTGSGKS